MAYKLDAGQQWLRDETTNELVGIKDSVDGEERLVVFATANLTGGIVSLVVSSAAPSDADGRPDGTIYVQTV